MCLAHCSVGQLPFRVAKVFGVTTPRGAGSCLITRLSSNAQVSDYDKEHR
jgi:hypothetical protein